MQFLEPKNAFVAVFDILGFRSLRTRIGTAALHQKFARGILPAIHHSAAGKGRVERVGERTAYVPDFTGSLVRFAAISDTVMFLTPDDSLDSFGSIVHSAFMLLQFGFNGGDTPFRGAIGWGDLIADPAGILVGSAIEDARAGEACQVWAGAMLTPSARDHADAAGYIEALQATHLSHAPRLSDDRQKEAALENARRLVKYRVPTQENPKDGPARYGETETYAIDWTIRMFENASCGAFGAPPDAHAARIAENTQRFETWARANRRQVSAFE